MDRAGQFALLALREAWADAGYAGPAREGGDPGADRVGVVLGCGMGGLTSLLANYDTLTGKGARQVSPHTIPMIMPNGPAGYASQEIGALAGTHSPASACASEPIAIA